MKRQFKIQKAKSMGLEMAEVVMDAEDLFKINVSESDEEWIRRAGDFHNSISKELEQRNWSKKVDDPSGPKWTEDEVWEELRQIIARDLNVPLERVTKEARFAEDLGAG